jgi:hypothetical protein
MTTRFTGRRPEWAHAPIGWAGSAECRQSAKTAELADPDLAQIVNALAKPPGQIRNGSQRLSSKIHVKRANES